MTLPRRCRPHAFTLIELIVTIVVLGLLAALAVPALSAVTGRAASQAREAEVTALIREAQAIAAFRGDGAWAIDDFRQAAEDTATAGDTLAAAGARWAILVDDDPTDGRAGTMADDLDQPNELAVELSADGQVAGASALGADSGEIVHVSSRIGGPPTTGRSQAGDNAATGTAALALVGADTQPNYGDVVRDDAPAGYWRFGDATADMPPVNLGDGAMTAAYDSAGLIHFGQPGLVADGDASISVRDGGAVRFGGDALTSLTLTLEAWVQIDDTAQCSASPKPIEQMRFRFQLTSNCQIDLWAYGTDGSFAIARSPNTLQPGQAHHVVGVIDGNTVQLYLDGQLARTATLATPQRQTSTYELLITGSSNNRFLGLVDEVAFYTHALPAERVAAHYEAGTPD